MKPFAREWINKAEADWNSASLRAKVPTERRIQCSELIITP